MIKILCILFTMLFFTFESEGKPVTWIKRSPKALLLGDAYTARATDEYTLFYNPATMGRHKGLSFSMLNMDVTATNALKEIDRFTDFPSNDLSGINERLQGFPVHVGAGITPTLKFDTFAMTLLAQTQANLFLYNATRPVLDVDYRYDFGFVFGGAFSWGSGKRQSTSKKRGSFGTGSLNSIGVAVKQIRREGLKGNFPLFGGELADTITSGGDIYELRDQLGFSKGEAWGFDLGYESVYNMRFSQAAFGISLQDIGNTQFNIDEGTRELTNHPFYINLGASWSQDFYFIDYTLSLDLKPVNLDIDLGRMVSVGLEVGTPILGLLMGWHAGHWSFGVEADLWLFNIQAGIYSVELGNSFKEYEGKRATVYLSLLDFSI